MQTTVPRMKGSKIEHDWSRGSHSDEKCFTKLDEVQ
jgi:hypothetical protein